MRRRSFHDEDFEFDEFDEYDTKYKVRHFRKPREEEQKKNWERESQFDNDLDDRR